MLILGSSPWRVKERSATPEAVYRNRRELLKAFVPAAAVGLARPAATIEESVAGGIPSPVQTSSPLQSLGSVPRRREFAVDGPLTDELLVTRQNIFDEISLERDQVWKLAAGLQTRPWTIHIGGAVEKAQTLDVEELVRRFGLEERLYRHRCVEAWSMAVPWIGFPMRKLVELAAPLSQARFVRMVSFHRIEEAPGWYASKRVFPYYEALSLEEATHDLAFLVTGLYGTSLPPQNGAPLRLAVPWKYGFKSIKSIVAFQFTREQPGTFWSELAPHMYDFAANVDPTSTEPWPQNREKMLGAEEWKPTLPYNGYPEVASLYA